jgi:DNA-binding MarR family transcriptional regulator
MPVLTKRVADESEREFPPNYRRVPAYLIRRLQLISVAVIAEAFEGDDMPVPQWAVLTVIHSHPDIDQSRLSELVSIDRTNTGRLVDQLEAKGLIERRPNGADRRVWMLRCTPRGAKLRERLVTRALASQDMLLSSLSKAERETFIHLMERVVSANETYVRPGAGRRRPKQSAIRR